MNIRTYININYVANKTRYIKAVIELPQLGMFSAIINCTTNKMQVGKNIYTSPTSRNVRQINGFGNFVVFHNLKEMEQAYQWYSATEKMQIRSVLNELKRSSFKFFKDVYNSSNITEMEEISNHILKLNQDYNYLYKNGTLPELQDEVNADEVEVNTNEVEVNKVRTFVKVAKMINASGLTDFVNGNFYQIDRIEQNGNSVIKRNGKFITLFDDNGIPHFIDETRL
jgi:hypothetical protein